MISNISGESLISFFFIQIKVTVPKNGYTTDLTHAVAKLTGCDSKKVLFVHLSVLVFQILVRL